MIIGCQSRKVKEIKLQQEKTNTTLLDSLANWNVFTQADSNFVVKTYINKLEFTENEEIKWFSTVAYVGKKDSITTWSGDPNFKYVIFDRKDYYATDFQNDILMKTVFKKDSVYKKPFYKAGGWDGDDPKAEFWEAYYKNPKLQLPKGNYTFKAFSDLSLSENAKNFNLTNKFKVVVK